MCPIPKTNAECNDKKHTQLFQIIMFLHLQTVVYHAQTTRLSSVRQYDSAWD